LELYFSENPFSEVSTFSAIKPSQQLVFEAAKDIKENLIKRSDFTEIKDAVVEVTEHREGLPPKKVSSFTWINPCISLKIDEK
jgi:hypothetical protein